MRVFLAGASGAIGRRLVPQLIDAGHEVVGTYNSPSSAERLQRLGAIPVELDLLNAGAVRKAVLASEPEAIVHQATALANVKFSRNMTMSRSTRSMLSSANSSSASTPSAAALTAYPSCSRRRRSSFRLMASSSAMRTVAATFRRS